MDKKLMDLTVIVCSANREELLEKFLIRWIKRNTSAKLLVVENSPKDETIQYLEKKYGSVKIQFIKSNPPGLSRARNLGLSKIKTRYATFTDDDCIISENFEIDVLDAFHKTDSSVIFGKILPVWPNNFDSTKMSSQLKESLALFDLGKSSRELKESEYGVGANMSIDVKKIQGFDFNESLGRTGANLLSGEEWDFQGKLRERGHKLYYCSRLVIYHLVDSKRLNPGWFISRFAWQGVTDAEMYSPDLHAYHLQEFTEFSGDIRSVLSNEWENLDKRLGFIRSLIALSLNSNIGQKSPKGFGTVYARPIPTTATKVIVEFTQGHQFMPKLLGAENTYTWFIATHPWNSQSDMIAEELRSLLTAISRQPSVTEVIFTSIESLLLESRVENFYQFLALSNFKVTGILHRISTQQEIIDNLRKIESHINIYVPSQTLQEELNEHAISVGFIPVVGTISPKNEIALAARVSEKTTFGIFGEIRDISLLSFIEEKILQLGDSRKNIEIRFVGGCRDYRILQRLKELKSFFNDSIDISNVFDTSNAKEFRGISPYDYSQQISVCDFILKFQIEERNVASAVVADSLSLGIPIVALRGTEAARQIQDILPQLIFDSASNCFAVLLDFDRESIERESLKQWMRLKVSEFRREILGE
jgi:glycosyltransferase involved in cell wall biosynthesis